MYDIIIPKNLAKNLMEDLWILKNGRIKDFNTCFLSSAKVKVTKSIWNPKKVFFRAGII